MTASGDDELGDGWLDDYLNSLPDAVLRLNFKRREDGGLRVWSDDVPGLHLSGKRHADVIRDIGPALAELIARNIVGDADAA